jgi:hypothetical protein
VSHQFIGSNFDLSILATQLSLLLLRFERLGHLADRLDALFDQFGLSLLLAANEKKMGLHAGESALHLCTFGGVSGSGRLGCSSDGLYSVSFCSSVKLAASTYKVVTITLLVFGLNAIIKRRRNEKKFLLFLALVRRIDDLVSGELHFPKRRQLVSVGAEFLVVRSVDGGEEEPGRIVDAFVIIWPPQSHHHIVDRTKGNVRHDA